MSCEWLHIMDGDGRTPLDRAFECTHRAVSEVMMQQERLDEAEARNEQGPPLHRAAFLGLNQAVRSLLHYEPDPNLRDLQGETALHKAVRTGNLAVAEELLPACDPNVLNADGLSPLHWACLLGMVEMADLLMRHGADPCLRSDGLDGLMPTDIAETMDYAELSELFCAREVFV